MHRAPPIPIEVPQHWMHRARVTQSTIPQAADERKIIIPGREIECRIERAAERGERLFGAVENFNRARRKTSGHGWRPSDCCDFGAPRGQHLQRQRAEFRRRPHAQALSFLARSHG